MENQPEVKPTIYVFLNKGLHMSIGKAAAQAGHAVAASFLEATIEETDLWGRSIHRTMIVLEARNAEHIHNIQRYLHERGIKTRLIIDEGVNEIDPHTPTALASKVLDKNDKRVIDAFSTFDLYRDMVKVTMELEK